MNKGKTKIKYILLLGIIITIILTFTTYFHISANTSNYYTYIQNTYVARMEGFINTTFHQTDILKAVVTSKNGSVSQDDFNNIAKGIYDSTEGIRAVQLLPGGTVEYCYPIEGNESTIGGNVFNNPKRVADANLAVTTKSIALSGPYELTQGGIGCVARNPIFLQDENGEEYFWGFSVIVLDLDVTLDSVGLLDLNYQGYELQLYTDTDVDYHIIIVGNEDMNTNASKQFIIQVPNHQWVLAIKEKIPVACIIATAILVVGLIVTLLLCRNYYIMQLYKEESTAKSSFLSNMSHDIRTPMNAILLLSDFGVSSENLNEAIDYHKKINSAGKYLLQLINDTLDLSKIEVNKFDLTTEPYLLKDLVSTINTIIIPKAQEKNINFKVENHFEKIDSQYVYFDSVRLQQILINLINNAIKFTPQKGIVTFSIFTNEKNEDIVFIFKVEDNGIGMSQSYVKNKLYSPFEQEKNQVNETGTGLGLAITKQLINVMGGTIECKSELSKGTTFTVILPTKLAQTPTKKDGNSDIDFEFLKDKRVLLVEDHPLNRQIAQHLLQKANIQYDYATNGKEAVQKFSICDNGYYDAILMDIRMPVMDGLEATKLIRSLPKKDAKKIPIIAMTANAFEEDKKKSLEVGMTAHLSKPIEPKILYSTLADKISDK